MTDHDLAGFVLARVAEDEAAARLALAQESYGFVVGALPMPVLEGLALPPRVLAEAEAKRRIVEAYQLTSPSAGSPLAGAVQALATIYRDHPDYQPRWRSWIHG